MRNIVQNLKKWLKNRKKTVALSMLTEEEREFILNPRKNVLVEYERRDLKRITIERTIDKNSFPPEMTQRIIEKVLQGVALEIGQEVLKGCEYIAIEDQMKRESRMKFSFVFAK